MYENKGFPIILKGSKQFLDQHTFKIDTTIVTGKPYPVSVQLAPMFNDKIQLLQPVIHVEIIDQNVRELIRKNRYQLKPQFFYVYYPSQIRVDEKIYKIFNRNYENLIDQIPRNFKLNFSKLINWEQGKGEASLQYQKHKINDALSFLGKQLIQKKIQNIAIQIKSYQAQPLTSKSMFHIFLLKNKLAKIYELLSLPTCAIQYLQDVWNQILYNFRPILKIPGNYKANHPTKLQYPPQMLLHPPYIINDINNILAYFESNECICYLRIVTFSFIKLFDFYLEQNHRLYDFEAIKTLRGFIDFILEYVLVMVKPKQWKKQEMMKYDVHRNLWIFQVISRCMEKLQQKIDGQFVRKDTMMSQSSTGSHITKTVEQYNRFHTGLCSILRNSVEKLGFLLYKMDNFQIFPKNLHKEIVFISEKISDNNQKQQEPTINLHKLVLNDLPINELLPENTQNVRDKTLKIFESYKNYSQIYINVLQSMESSLKNSPYKKVAQSLLLTIKKAIIMHNIDNKKSQTADNIVNNQIAQGRMSKNWGQIGTLNKFYDLIILLQAASKQVNNKDIIKLCDRKLKQLFVDYNYIFAINSQKQYKFEIFGKFLKKYQQIISKKQNIQNHNCYVKIGKIIRIQSNTNNKFQIQFYIQNINNMYYSSMGKTICLQKQKQVIDMLLLSICQRIYLKAIAKSKQNQQLAIQLQNISNYLIKTEYDKTVFKLEADLQFNQYKQIPLIIKFIWLEIQLQKNIKIIIETQQECRKQNHNFNLPTIQLCSEYNNAEQISMQNIEIYTKIWNPITFKVSNLSNKNFKLHNFQIIGQNSQKTIQIHDHILFRDKCEKQCSKQLFINKNQIQIYRQIPKLYQQQNFYVTFFIKIKQQFNLSQLANHQNQKIIGQFQLKFDDSQVDDLTLHISSPVLKFMPIFTQKIFNIHNLRQYIILSNSMIPLKVVSQDAQYQFMKSQELHLWNPSLTIVWQNYQGIINEINLQKNSQKYFMMEYIQQDNWKIFEPIQIKSQRIGQVNVLGDTLVGFQLIGKIKGQVKYVQGKQNDKIIDLYLVPVKTGNLRMPDIEIDGQWATWNKNYIIDVQSQCVQSQ